MSQEVEPNNFFGEGKTLQSTTEISAIFFSLPQNESDSRRRCHDPEIPTFVDGKQMPKYD